MPATNQLRRADTPASLKQTALSIHTFVLACILYPDFVRTAQEQLDAIIGMERLPTFEDRPHLPYIEAVLRGVYWKHLHTLLL
jgi:hypothetical protein